MYTIIINEGGYKKRDQVLEYLEARLIKEGKFRATLERGIDMKSRYTILIRPVRLVKAKPYCGQHAFECPVGTKKKNATYLEFNDWIKFHGLVNRVLNKFRTNADVFSTPLETRGKFWIRKGHKARVKWDVEQSFDQYGRRVQHWNNGTIDQFDA
jgi:hypothetical protein